MGGVDVKALIERAGSSQRVNMQEMPRRSLLEKKRQESANKLENIYFVGYIIALPTELLSHVTFHHEVEVTTR